MFVFVTAVSFDETPQEIQPIAAESASETERSVDDEATKPTESKDWLVGAVAGIQAAGKEAPTIETGEETPSEPVEEDSAVAEKPKDEEAELPEA